MHPISLAPPHVLKHLRRVILEDFPLDSITKYLEQDWKPGFTTQDILDWAVEAGLRPALEGAPLAARPGAPPTQDATVKSEAKPWQNSSISKDFKAIQAVEGHPQLPPLPSVNSSSVLIDFHPWLNAPQPKNPSISNDFKPIQGENTSPLPPVEDFRDNPQSTIRNPQSKPRRRTGKVAQLPSAIREHVNQMLDDGRPYREIIDWLTTNGHPGFNQENISNWAQGGFQDWLNHQDALDQHKILAEYAKQIVAECPGTTFKEACDAIIQMDFYSALNRFDMNGLHQLLKDKPEFWFRLITTMTSFNRAKLAEDKFKWQKAQAEKKEAVREGVTSTCAQTPTPGERGIHPASESIPQSEARNPQSELPIVPPASPPQTSSGSCQFEKIGEIRVSQNPSISNESKPIQSSDHSPDNKESATTRQQSEASSQLSPTHSVVDLLPLVSIGVHSWLNTPSPAHRRDAAPLCHPADYCALTTDYS